MTRTNELAAQLQAERKAAKRLPWRPTKYRPEFCQQVVEHCSKGLSVASFGAIVDTSRENLYEWADKYPDFDAAMKRARLRTQIWWELRQVANAERGASGGQVAQTIFALKNFGPDDFRERIEHTGKDGQALSLELLLGKALEEAPRETRGLEPPTIESETLSDKLK